MLQAILGFLGGGIVKQFTDPLLAAYQMRVNAANDTERIEADKTIARIEAGRDIALAEAGRAWSATSLGRWLIVVPFGLWWAAIFIVQILNPWIFIPVFGFRAVVIAIPPDIMEMAKILVPAIILGDASTFAIRKLGR
jgi:hypothetical protein